MWVSSATVKQIVLTRAEMEYSDLQRLCVTPIINMYSCETSFKFSIILERVRKTKVVPVLN